MPASVTIEDNEAEFEASEADERATLALCDLLEEAGRGRMTLIELASRLRELTEAAPEQIDARAHLGSVLLESEQLQEAAAEYERAFEIGSKALPTDFDGRIEWIRLDNRPFLRAAYGLALVRLKTGKRTEAIRLMEQLLRWNPNDNQGVRLSIGSEYLRAGHRAKAGRVLREHADEYPPYRFELGLLHLQKQKWAEAATSLRRGFVDNPYIAEILCGNPDPMPLPIWEGSNWQGTETAKEYVERLATEAVDEVRRAEQRGADTKTAKTLKGSRYCLLKHPKRLKPGEKRRLAAVRLANRALDRAYELKEYLATILEQATPDDARELLDQWLDWASRSRLAPFVKLARTIRKHAVGILAYLDTRMTNGPVEGINNKLRVIARRAYGFHSHGALISMLFLCCGGIELAPPLPTRV